MVSAFGVRGAADKAMWVATGIFAYYTIYKPMSQHQENQKIARVVQPGRVTKNQNQQPGAAKEMTAFDFEVFFAMGILRRS